jgi:enoyl-[acyl-carrier protein] reductase I
MNMFFDRLGQKWSSFDFIVNGMAYANKEDLTGRYMDISREGFLKALDISCYAFTRSVALSQKFMQNGGSCLALTYYGAEKWMPHYNIMGVAKAALEASVRYLAADVGPLGIRVNAISAGPIRTLAASGIGDFRYILDWCAKNAPLQKNTTIEDVGNGALYLLSDLGSNVTGEILHVDSGYNIVGMKNPDSTDIQLR